MDALRFDRFELRPARRELLADGEPIEIGARALDLLIVLIEQAGQLITKDALLDRVWPDVFVEEANLHVQVSTLRRLLGRDAIATVPGRGYQFVRPLQARPANAPAPTAAVLGLPVLYGRDAELTQAQALLESGRLLTITGAGGCGKTLLARHLMHRLQKWRPQGVAWVDLLELDDAVGIPAAVSSSLGFEGGPSTVPALARALRADDRLVVLDNAEHLLDAVRGLASALLEAAPALRILVTSQAPLKLPDEQRLALGGLSVPAAESSVEAAGDSPAVALFAERARQVERRFRLDEHSVSDVIAIATALGGSALGLQLAASLLAMQPLTEVRQRLAPLAPPGSDVPPPPAENVLRAALAWSHGLLADGPQRVFRRMAVALGPLPLPLLTKLAIDDTLDSTGVADALSDLVDRSLVACEAAEGSGTLHYRLLDAPRATAAEALRASGETQERQALLARALAEYARAWRRRWMYSEDALPISTDSRGQQLMSDLMAALRWCLVNDLADAADLAQLPAWYRRPAAERLQWLQRLVDGAATLPVENAGQALFAAAMLTKHSDPPRRQALLLQAARCFEQVGAERERYVALARAAEVAAILRTPDLAEEPLADARALERPDWPPALRENLAVAEAAQLSARDEHVAALQAWRHAVALSREVGKANPLTLASMADTAMTIGDAAAATLYLTEAAELAHQRGDRVNRWALILANLAAARLMQGDTEGARSAAAESWPYARDIDADAWWADHLALLAALEGRPRSAALLLGLADAAYQRINDGRHQIELRHAAQAEALARKVLGDEDFEALRLAGAESGQDAMVRVRALQREDAPRR